MSWPQAIVVGLASWALFSAADWCDLHLPIAAAVLRALGVIGMMGLTAGLLLRYNLLGGRSRGEDER